MLETLVSQAEVVERWEELCNAARILIKKTGGHGQTPELLMYQMFTTAGQPTSFILVNLDDNNRLDGLLFAVAITGHGEPWIEVIAMWSKPGVATKVMYGAFDMLASWAKSLGASRILAATTRSPERFFNFFYSKLGFEKVGLIVERRI